jgi:Fe-S oxidoreductase
MEGLRDQILVAETALAAAASAQRAWKGGANGGAAASEDALRLARDRADEALSLPLIDNAIPEEAVWQCTTCGWCVEGCPVLIEHVDTIVEIRRNAVLEESRFPKELNAAFRNMENAGNPWGQPKSARLDWAKGLDVSVLGEADAPAAAPAGDGRWRTIHSTRPADHDWIDGGGVLFWVGCAGAFDDRNRKVVRAMAQLLRQAEVPFFVLGSGETCTGDRLGGRGTSTSTRCWPRRTWPRSRRRTISTASGRSWRPARTVSTRSATSTRSSGSPACR